MRKLSFALIIIGYVYTILENEMVVAAPAAPIGMAHVPAQVGTAISKTVHYAETPIVTGYTSTVYKPDMSAVDIPFKFNHQQRYLRPIRTLVPKMVPVSLEPKVPVDVSPMAAVQVAAVAAATGREVEIHPQPPILPEIRVANPTVYFPPLMAPLIR